MEIECKIISNCSKRTEVQGADLLTIQTELPPTLCTLSIKVNLAEGHSSTHHGAGPMEMFYLEPKLWEQRTVRSPYILSSSKKVRCRACKNKGSSIPRLPRHLLGQKIQLHSLSASNLTITQSCLSPRVSARSMCRAVHIP